MKRAWLAVVGLLVISSAILIALRRGEGSEANSELNGKSSPSLSRRPKENSAEKGKISGSRNTVERMSDEELKAEANRLLLELNESQEYARILLQSQLSSLFREWGYRDIAAAERFLETDNAAQGSFDGTRLDREDLILAAWIGYARAHPADAWARFSKAWAEEERELIINPALRPLPHESAGYHLFKAYYDSDPASAVAWIRNRDVGLGSLAGPALQVVMAATPDSNERLQLFTEFCSNDSARSMNLALVCAGIAEQEPEQAWEFIYGGREDTDGSLTSESPESIASDMILHWSIQQPEQALEFILSPEREKLRTVLLQTFIMTQLPRRPELIIPALEHKDLSVERDKFQVAIAISVMLHNRFSWPLVDENLPLPPEERVRIMTEAVRTSNLPPPIKTDFLSNLAREL